MNTITLTHAQRVALKVWMEELPADADLHGPESEGQEALWQALAAGQLTVPVEAVLVALTMESDDEALFPRSVLRGIDAIHCKLAKAAGL